MSEQEWATGIGLRTYGAASLAEFVFLRWREVELHAIDLGLSDVGGPDWSSISSEYLAIETEMSLRGLAARMPENAAVLISPDELPSYVIGFGFNPVTVRAPGRAILKWMTGRGGEEGWPMLATW